MKKMFDGLWLAYIKILPGQRRRNNLAKTLSDPTIAIRLNRSYDGSHILQGGQP